VIVSWFTDFGVRAVKGVHDHRRHYLDAETDLVTPSARVVTALATGRIAI
jgi:hypothetical protein